MKTTLSPRTVFILMILSSLAYQVQAAGTKDTQKLEATRFENTWVPSIQLKEVEISATRSSNQIVEAVSYQGSLIPSIHMNEVNINASGNYEDNDVPAVGFIEPKRAAYLTDVALYNGEYIPVIQLHEVNVEALAIVKEVPVKDNKVQRETQSGIFQVNARQTFKVLVDFIVLKSLEVARHFVPVGATE